MKLLRTIRMSIGVTLVVLGAIVLGKHDLEALQEVSSGIRDGMERKYKELLAKKAAA